MNPLISKVRTCLGSAAALFSPVALAEQTEFLGTFNYGTLYVFIFFAVIVGVVVYFMKFQDKRGASLESSVIDGRKAIHSVGPDTPVIQCVRTMVTEKVSALIVIDGENVTGIFTEQDALSKVLAAGLDPTRTNVSEVMTKDPYCVPPKTSVGDALGLLAKRGFRHLPVVESGKVVAVLSSGDLAHWLVKGQTGEVQNIVDLAGRRQLE